jgi:hypothetical protein
MPTKITSSSSPNMSSPQRTSRRQSGLGTKPTAHFICVVGDRSGSMQTMGTALPEQIGALIADLRKTANKENVPTFLTIITFDDKLEVYVEDLELHGDAPLPSAEDISHAVRPRGMTRFYDAIIMGLDKLVEKKKNYISGLSKEIQDLGTNVLISLPFLTDGMDNSSTSTAADFKVKYEALGDEINAYGLFANIDASIAGQELGMSKATTVQMSADYAGASQCLRAVSNSLQRATTVGTSDTSSFADDVSSAAATPTPSTPPTMPLNPPQMPGFPQYGNAPLPLRRY